MPLWAPHLKDWIHTADLVELDGGDVIQVTDAYDTTYVWEEEGGTVDDDTPVKDSILIGVRQDGMTIVTDVSEVVAILTF